MPPMHILDTMVGNNGHSQVLKDVNKPDVFIFKAHSILTVSGNLSAPNIPITIVYKANAHLLKWGKFSGVSYIHR